ncbi:MAG: hypothetical protein HYY41_03745 [Chloroflexi bacterium]|nr:hypothetical protein [Chloroflexota bacterium]MBI2979923.1 hypothetical protein [Chloroflexota bacterium]
MNIAILPLLSIIISFIFAVTVLDQFFARRRPYQLIYMFELLGIIIIFTGFLRNREVFGFYRFPFIHRLGRISS